jgi:hypothetical protein
MDDEDYLSHGSSHALAPQRPSRITKPAAGFYKMRSALPPMVAPRRNKGKRKRATCSSDIDEDSKNTNGDPDEAIGLRSTREAETYYPRTPPSDCVARLDKIDADLYLGGESPKMKLGQAPKFYAKIVRPIEGPFRDANGRSIDIPKEEVYRMPSHPPVRLAKLDLGLLRSPDCAHRVPNLELVRFIRRHTVLPLLKQWAYMWLNPEEPSEEFHKEMRRTFSMEKPMKEDRRKTWIVAVRMIAVLAAGGGGFNFEEKPRLLHAMASFARKLVNANGVFFDSFSKFCWAVDEPYKFAARLLLLVWEDVERDQKGFFREILKGELAMPNLDHRRKAYEGWYYVDERLYE